MNIKCWGSRGSIPVSGKEYTKYGGNTTCLEIRTQDNQVIIIDAGSGIRELGNHLIRNNYHDYNIILTHAHWDHILGFPFFKPIYSPKTQINMFGCPFAQDSIKDIISRTMAFPNFPVDFDDIQSKIEFNKSCDDGFQIGTVTVDPIPLSHPGQGRGYKFVEDNKCFIFLTDNELSYKHPGGLNYDDYVNLTHDADLLIHDAEFTEEEYRTTKTWGHSVFTKALKLALDANVKTLGLFHHNQERTDGNQDNIVHQCNDMINDSGANLECYGVYDGMEIIL